MQSKRPGWEGVILAFAIIFTVLFGSANVLVATFNRGTVPWLLILLVSLAAAVSLRYIPRQPK